MILTESQNKEFLRFIYDHKGDYDKGVINFILDHYNSDHPEADSYVITQIYSVLGIKPIELDIYDASFNILKSEFSLNRNILEIGCGEIPVLASKIDEEQQRIGAGSISAYDPCLIYTKKGKIKLFRETFHYGTDISSYDLVCGFYPCDATLTIINRSCDSDKDFIVGLCGCDHRGSMFPFPIAFSTSWEEYILDKTEEACDGKYDIDIKHFDERYDSPYPIIIAKHK